ncbi:hypothetical protein A6R68_09537 [Neotoma lepida]|uniref:SPATA31 domain-containing protein n=1 Tax=Neotoma lepida TaxID=56216 RepID=A0A1A6G0H1_NEOLE|nr:hypothetical protein A6R68_09537 [Neotoma lepida]
MGRMLQSCSSKQATTRNCKSEQFSGHQQFFYQKVLGNDLQQICSQLFWGLPFLHSESLVATVNLAGSPLDPASILFGGLSTYIPIQLVQSNWLESKPRPVNHPLFQRNYAIHLKLGIMGLLVLQLQDANLLSHLLFDTYSATF